MEIEKKWYDKVITVLCILCFALTLLYLIKNWGEIPKEIPGHYNAAGEVDKMSSKSSLFVGFGIGVFLYLGLCIVEHFPRIWNTGVQVTEKNRKKVYRNLKNMLSASKLSVSFIFSFLTMCSATGGNLPGWWTAVMLFMVLGPLFYFAVRIYQCEDKKES